MEIRSKQEFYNLWRAGVLGNRTQLWSNPLDAFISNVPTIGFREIGKTGGGAWCRVPRCELYKTYDEWRAADRKFIMDDGVPNEHSIMQGEVCRTIRGLESFLAIGQGLEPMRLTMAAGLHKHRGYLETKILLETYMDPASRDDLDALLELYPEATVEFTSFDVCVGNIPGRQTMFWETRNY